MIAHGGGIVDEFTGTNSKEAVEASIQNGFSLVELDFLVTKDKKIVAGHDWKRFYQMSGMDSKNPQPLMEEEAMKQKILGKYTPLNGSTVLKILEENPEVTLVTDKIRDLRLLREKIFLPERTIVEVFSVLDYWEAKELGYAYPAYRVSSLGAVPPVYACHISVITAPERMIRHYPEVFKNLHEQGVTILVYTGNDIDFVKKYQGTHFSLLYTDQRGFEQQ